MTFKLIACDGGGIRGYISSSLIQDMDQETGGKLLSGTDGFAGTSTGGLISVALGAGVSIAEVQNIYAKRAAEIFTKNKRWREEGEMAEADLEGPGKIGCAYTSKGLAKIMTEYLGDRTFGDISAGKMVAVTTAQLEDRALSPVRWAPVTFNNRDAPYATVRLVDACLSTSAAPAYFPPHPVAGMGFFADGGTFANNPVMNGIEVARGAKLLGSTMDIQVISFGTGLMPVSIPPASIPKPLKWGVNYWLWPRESRGVPAVALLNLALDLSAANLTTIAQGLLGDNLVRINPALTQNIPLDGYSPAQYKLMDAAITAAKASAEWQRAKAIVAGW